jgi:uncharacterized membrane protein
MTTTKSYFSRPRVVLIGAALAASVMAVVLASPASTAQTTVPAGTPLGWGENFFGQTDVPSGLTDVIDVDAGLDHNLAVKQVAELGPTSTDDCENGGYKDFGFKNQGQCIKAVNKTR